jgi:hypothetical protein
VPQPIVTAGVMNLATLDDVRSLIGSAATRAAQRFGRLCSGPEQIIRRESYQLQCPTEANDILSAARSHRYSEKLQSLQPEIRRRSLHHPAESTLVALAYFEPKYLVPA